MKKFQTHFNIFPHEGEKNNGGSITEQSYVKFYDQIKNMLEAGARLERSRRPKIEEDTDLEVDPTAVRGFDAADAARMAQSTKAKLLAALEKRDKEIKARKEAADLALTEKEVAAAKAKESKV